MAPLRMPPATRRDAVYQYAAPARWAPALITHFSHVTHPRWAAFSKFPPRAAPRRLVRSRTEMPALAMLPMVALSVAALHAHLHVAAVVPRVPGARRAVRMSTAEEEAKRAWMAKQEGETGSTPRVSNEEAQATMQAANAAARARGLAAMGGKDALRSGKMQGFGAVDTEYYGYGEQMVEMPDEREIDLLTGKPLNQEGDYDSRAQGFGGRSAGWARKPETIPSGPPPMEGTLRAPGQVRLTLTSTLTPTLTLSPSPTLALAPTLALTLLGAGAALAASGARAGLRVWLRRRRGHA